MYCRINYTSLDIINIEAFVEYVKATYKLSYNDICEVSVNTIKRWLLSFLDSHDMVVTSIIDDEFLSRLIIEVKNYSSNR